MYRCIASYLANDDVYSSYDNIIMHGVTVYSYVSLACMHVINHA